MRTFVDVELVLERNGVIATREYPELRGAINRRVRNGQLVPVLPGVYTSPAGATDLHLRMAAVPLWDRNAIITHEAAAALTFWPDIKVPVIRCAVRHEKASQPGYIFLRERIPPELVWRRGAVQLTNPTLTALDLAADTDGGSIDRALLRRKTTLDLMHKALALTGRRRGNPERRKLLLDSRDEPWSAAERLLHRLLRSAGIEGWRANKGVIVGGSTYFPDALFWKLRLLIEVDGRQFHSEPEVFESDRWRQNLLILDGWCVLRFTYAMLCERPKDVLDVIRRALDMAGQASMAAAN